MSVLVRNDYELKLMRESGKISAKALKAAIEASKPGVNLLDIERVAEETILKLGGKSSFKTEPGYHWTTCLTVNDEVVHGIPRDYVLEVGDVLKIDLGAIYKGWHTDCAWAVLVGYKEGLIKDEKKERFLKAGEEALWAGVNQAVAGNKIGDISAMIQKTIEGYRYSVSRQLVGHGVGKSLHEDPQVANFGVKGTGMGLKSGMTIAIEPIYAEKGYQMVVGKDGWIYKTKDGGLGGLFEMSVIVLAGKVEVLTDWRKV